ncbi:MAG: hypothetical protein V2I40_12005 [Desulfobacteraceae bacterium]|jgi:hypothetical protein|nr:hypothetical protein [Desulfobacteraceae bacterium]
MKWTFWKKAPAPNKPSTWLTPGPLPQLLFTHLVDEMNLGSDWVKSLGCVARPVAGQKYLFTFRTFSPSQTSLMGIEVIDYATLDGYAHLILFSGTLNTQTGKVNLKPEIQRRVA